MANLGRKLYNIQTLSSFTAKVVYDASKRYGATQANVTFNEGYEYTGVNFFKGLNRPPKLRILKIIQPLVSAGTPNSTNDTYVAFQVYDYTLSVWRGPWCKRAGVNDPWTYADYFVTTIDSFGRKYGNQYTGSGSQVTTFIGGNSITANFSDRAYLYISGLGMTINVIAGHNPSVWLLGGADNKTYHFNGFLTLSGYSGTWCFYSIAANGSGIGFNHLLDEHPYNTGAYPNVLPYTNKLTSEWRLAPFCNIGGLSYSPRIKVDTNNGLGPIKYYAGPNPGDAFPVNAVSETEVWCTYDPTDPTSFFLAPLWAPGGSTEESAQGVEGTGAANYAPAGWYGTSLEDSYQYYNGNGTWDELTYATYKLSRYTPYNVTGPYAAINIACVSGPRDIPVVVYGLEAIAIGVKLFSDSEGTTPFNGTPNLWYFSQDNLFGFTLNGNTVSAVMPC